MNTEPDHPPGSGGDANSPPRPSGSLARRLTLFYAVSAFCLVLATSGILYWALVHNLDVADDQFLADQVHVLRMLLQNRPDDIAGLRQEAEWESAARRYTRVYVRVLDEKHGIAVVETPRMGTWLAPSAFPEPIDANAEPTRGTDVRPDGDRLFRVMAARARIGGSEADLRAIQVAVDEDDEEDLLAAYRTTLIAVVGVALLACAFVGNRIARHGVRPIEEIAGASRRIRSTTLHERIEARGLPSEIAELASGWNEMLDRLEKAFDRLSRFSADIAHELRTPVNNLRGEVEVALGKARTPEQYRRVLESNLEECQRLTRTIDSLLFLARAESPEAQIAHEKLDVARELSSVRDFFEASAAEHGVRLTLSAPEGIGGQFDRTLFQRAIGNLVENALRHTAPGGEIVLRTRLVGGEVLVEVADTGCGIAPVHLPHVFDRLYRADSARSSASGGAGLGLAIVKTIAELHGGSARIASAEGHGTCVTLAFPTDGGPRRDGAR
ncbi:MAG: heavy metal sensor histidine kinase [Planctomycetes bacterium]|nr:heavy metal sensor histidine kinase [Planctomycetota bacterium]MBI3847108.1 heavy metal sensor histidine kinase [Planctomycetota bacterium]